MAPHIVDIGLPTFGSGPFIIEAVESVVSQTFTSWRLLISENGPGNGEIFEKLKPYLGDNRIEYTATKDYIKACENFTRASQGSAPYVALIHDDDRWDPEWLERRVKVLGAEPSCGFVFSQNRVIDENGKEVGSNDVHRFELGVLPISRFLPIVYEQNVVNPSTVLVRRSAYEAVGPYYIQGPYTDHELWIRIAGRFPVAHIPVCDADYRVHPSQTSSQTRSRAGMEALRLLDSVDPWVGVPMSLKRRARAKTHLQCCLDAIEQRDRAEALKHLMSALRLGAFPPRSIALMGRVGAAIALLVSGERGRKLLSHWRNERWRRHGTRQVAKVRSSPSEPICI